MWLSGIFVYPIKACAGFALQQAAVVERGLAFDRRYMLVDRTGTFVSQREVPKLCLVQCRLEGPRLCVSAPGSGELELPTQLPDVGFPAQPFRVWGSTGHGLRHPEGSRWFSDFLNDDVSLLYMPDAERRAVNPKRAQPGDIVSFADGYPVLLLSEASLADLNRRLPAPVDMRQFRPNLVLAGCEPYAEDHFEAVAIGNVTFRGVKRCERCVVTTIDPNTAVRSQEPLRTLAGYRREGGKIWFGMNLIHDGYGTLAVGDVVRPR